MPPDSWTAALCTEAGRRLDGCTASELAALAAALCSYVALQRRAQSAGTPAGKGGVAAAQLQGCKAAEDGGDGDAGGFPSSSGGNDFQVGSVHCFCCLAGAESHRCFRC